MADVSEDTEEAGVDTGAGIAYEPGTTPPLKDLPTRDDIDFLRGSWQFTPSELNTYIDQQRPLLVAVGFSPDEIDDYYGVEHFDAGTAAQQLLGAVQAPDNPGFAATASGMQPASTNPDYLLMASQSPDLFGQVMDMQASP